MKPIYQLYATHCTYGTSALEQREGELAERVLGYSARAGSLERAELRNCYRQVERFLYYYLPTDTPTEEKLRFEAATAPRRMFYCPSLGELQVLGQISYRQQDTAGRPGSYFGHVLFGRRADGAWPVLECLKLWGAAWVDEDSPSLTPKLAALKSLGELRAGKRPSIDDDVLLSFLKTPPGEPFDDPGKIIPERWKLREPAERAELLTETLQGFLNLGSQRRENLLLVVEPAVAALLFYGVARLLPPGAVRDSLSFSTFEPNADRLPVSLAATMFHAPETTDLRPEAYRRRGYVYNTFLDRHSDHGRPEGLYGPLLVGKLLAEGFDGVDRLFSGFEAAGAQAAEDLELLADVHRLVPQVLDSEAPLDETRWRKSDVAVRYLSLAVHRQLANDAVGWPQLRGLIGSPNQLLVMELIASAPDAGDIQAPLQFLLRKLPPDKFGELLASDRLPRSAKIEALAFHVSSVGQFPEHCESLWSEVSRLKSMLSGRSEPLLPSILARLPAQVIGPLYRTLPVDKADAFLRALLQAARPEPDLQAAQRAVAAGIFKDMDDERFLSWLLNHRDELRSYFPPPDDVLRPRLAKLLFEIPDYPEQLEARLDALEGWVDYFSEPSLAERRIVQWRKIRSILLSIREADGATPSNRLQALFRRAKPPDYRGLAEALNSAMPMTVYQDDMRGTKKLECLHGLGRAMLGRPEFLPPVVRSRMLRYFEYGDWSEFSGAGKKKGGKSAGKKKSKYGRGKKPSAWQSVLKSKLFAFGGGAALIVLVGLAYNLFTAPNAPQLSGKLVDADGPDALAPSTTASVGAGKVPVVPPERDPSESGTENKRLKPVRGGTADAPTGQPPKDAEGMSASNESPKPDESVPVKEADRPGAQNPRKQTSGGESGRPKSASPPASPNGAPPARERTAPVALTMADCKELPSLQSKLLTAYRPIDLISWKARPEGASLRLHGVELANAELKEQLTPPNAPAELVCEMSKDQLVVSAQIGGATPATIALATFTAADDAVQFQWHEPSEDSVSIAACQRWVRACVLEVHSAKGSTWAALRSPAKQPALHLISGAVSMRPPFRLPALAPLRRFNLQLRRGVLHLHDDRTFPIEADADDPRRPALVRGLGEEFGLGAVRLALERDASEHDVWIFKLQTEDSAEMLEVRKQRDELLTELRRLEEPLARFQARDASVNDKREAASKLESLLAGDSGDVPKKAEEEKPPLKPAEAHARERRIVAEAERRRRSLQRLRDELKRKLDERQLGATDLMLLADSISAVLYREVADNLRVDSIILGEPGPEPRPEPDEYEEVKP